MIPKILHHIWIGPHPAPVHWMNTWKENHPTWEYKLWDNHSLGTFNFKNAELIHDFLKLKKYSGVANLMRYEILYRYGGFIPEADSICLNPVDDLLEEGIEGITVYENEKIYGDKKVVSPILASIPKYDFLGFLIEKFYKERKIIKKANQRERKILTSAYISGNQALPYLIEQFEPNLLILPSNCFIGNHLTNIRGCYSSNPKYNKRYSAQFWGTGRKPEGYNPYKNEQ